MRKLGLLFILIYASTLSAVECKRDRLLGFQPEGTVTFGKVQVINRFQDGECNLVISVHRGEKNGHRIAEQFTISDKGKLMSFVSSPESFKSSTNSRATGSRVYYTLPRVKENVSYEFNKKTDELAFTMANGETLTLSTKSGEITSISNTKWKKDQALRNYVRKNKVVAQDVYSKRCHNCGLKYKGIKYDKFEYVKGGLVLESVKNGILLDTGTLRGEDARLPTLWGNQKETHFIDQNGVDCKIQNRFIYKYIYEELPGRDGKIHRSIDGINIKFTDDNNKFPTRKGMQENFPEFLKRVCVKNKKIKNFDVSVFNRPSLDHICKQCQKVPGKSALDSTAQFGAKMEEIGSKLQTEVPYSIQVGAFGVLKNAQTHKLNSEEIRQTKCQILKGLSDTGAEIFRVKCQK